MKKAERAAYIQEKLQSLYPETPVPLDHSNNFTLLVAVLLSAQCTDARVNTVTPELFALADNARDMTTVPLEDIERIVKPCGLAPRKAHAIAKLSQILVAEHDAEVPQDWEALEALPGVGHKTASVVMSQGFGIPAMPVDTHIHRLAQRWGLTKGNSVQQTERDLKKLFPESAWNALHLQIIFYGREFCTARGCNGTVLRDLSHLLSETAKTGSHQESLKSVAACCASINRRYPSAAALSAVRSSRSDIQNV